MHQRSNISASLYKKKQLSLLKKIGAYFVFALFFISLAILGLTTDKARINDIVISGNSSVLTENIIKIVNSEINVNYLWIIPTDNILLLRREEIKKRIIENIKKIGSIQIIIHRINKIEVKVKERESKNLWCKGTPIDIMDCYFMDSSGFIFEKAPTFSVDTFPEYFGLITGANSIGQFYFKNKFNNISGLYNALIKMLFEPKYFYALTEYEYEVYILGGGKIIINDKRSFESSLTNLQALVDNGYIKTDLDSIKKIKYIDLRFGSKVNFELNK
jgi:hypothetical protein